MSDNAAPQEISTPAPETKDLSMSNVPEQTNAGAPEQVSQMSTELSQNSTKRGLPSIEDVIAKFMGRGKKESKAAPTPAVTELAVEASSEEEEEVTPAEVVQKAEVPVAAPKDLTSSKFAALARREKEARSRAEQAERAQKAAEERIASIEERSGRFDRLKQDPLGFLKGEGISYSDLTMQALNMKDPEPVDPMDAKLDPLRKDIENLTKKELTELKQQVELLHQDRRNNALREVDSMINDTIKGNGEKYEFLDVLGDEGKQTVRDVMTEYYHSYGKVLTYEEACDKVEEYYSKYADKLSSTKKMQSKFAPKTETKAPSKPSTPKEVKQPNTLTNSLSAAQPATDLNKLPKHKAIEILAQKYQNLLVK